MSALFGSGLENTCLCTTGTLRWRTLVGRPPMTGLSERFPGFKRLHFSGVTALFAALLQIVTTVTFLALFHNLITTEGAVVFLKAVVFALIVEDCVKY